MAILLLAMFIAIPIIEIGLFIEIGGWIGLWPTLAIVIVTAFAGTTLLRLQGLAVLQRAQASTARNELPVQEVFDGLCLLMPVFCCLRPAFSPMRWVLCCLCPRFGGLRRFQSVVGWSEAVKYPFRRVVLVPGRLGPDPVLVPDRVGGAARPAGARRRAVPLLMVISKRLILRRRTATGWALKTGSDWQ